MSGPDWGRMVGPLPLGAWVAVVGGGLAAMYWTSSKPGGVGNSGGYTMVSNSTEDGVGEGGSGQWVDLTPRQVIGEPARPETNDTWAKAAIDYLIASGYSPTLAQQAISRMMSGAQLTPQEKALADIAMIKLGSPPGALSPTEKNVPINPPVIALPTPKPPAPKPVPKPAPKPVPSPAKVRTYRVVRGDNLTKIGRKYGKTWQQIFNANKDKIKNPNLIYPGQVLKIPN